MKDGIVQVYESFGVEGFDTAFEWRYEKWVIYSRFLTPDHVQEKIDLRNAHCNRETETLWHRFWRGLQYLGFEKHDQDTSVRDSYCAFFSLNALMARVAKVKGLNILLGEPADIFDGLVANDPGKAAVLNYEFARRQAKVFYLNEVLDYHQAWMSPDQVKRKCIRNCPSFSDIQWFEENFRKNNRIRKSKKSSGRPCSRNDDHVALMKNLYRSLSLLDVAKKLLEMGINAPNGKPYSPQNVDYYLNRRHKRA